MTDKITPASLRAHAEHMERVHLDGISAAELLQEAARLEAESAREVEVLQFAKRLVQEEFGGYNQWHDLSTSEQERRVQYVKFILAFLAADGRLLPEGGTALTAEQTAKLLARLAVADVKPVSWYRSMEADFASEHFGFPSPGELKHTASDGGKWVWDESMSQWELRQYPPAVSVPDSAICGEPGPRGSACIEKQGHSGGHFALENAPDSGPDGTPEKPWPTLNEVPGHVSAVLDVTGVEWARSGASGAWFGCDGQLRCCKGHPEVAPFVRVDGDKA